MLPLNVATPLSAGTLNVTVSPLVLLPDSVDVPPTRIVLGLAVTVTVGVALFTVSVAVAVCEA